MLRRFLIHLRNQWMGAVALFLVLSGGTAYALTGSNTVFSDDIVDGQVAYADLRDKAMTGTKILDDSVTGADVKESTLSGVDRCPAGTAKYGRICAQSDGNSRSWYDSVLFCPTLGLRVPTLSEAVTLGFGSDVPGVAPEGRFWTDSYFANETGQYASVVTEEGVVYNTSQFSSYKTVCVTDLTN